MGKISKLVRLPSAVFFRDEDERIYAAVRIAFATVALLNLIFLWPNRHVFFSDAGMVARDAAASQAYPLYFSVFALAGSGAAVSAVMIITALALVLLMSGIATRLAAFWVLLWHISYMARAPLPLAGWDAVLRCFSFLILVSPIGKCWTVPALLRDQVGPLPRGLPAYGLILMRLQVFVIYWQAVLARLLHPDPYWGNGEFLSYFMLSHHARWPGTWVLEHGDLMAFGTYAIQLMEAAIPLLLWFRKTRWYGMLLGAALHVGISVFARDLELFCLSMLMSYLAFLRKDDVDAVEHFLKRRLKRST